jgi:hypothetical protein
VQRRPLSRPRPPAPTAVRAALPLVALLAGASATAQAPSDFPQDSRPGVLLAATLGRGDAATAVAGPDAAFFTNPALLARLDLARPRIQILGAGGSIGGSAWDVWTFYRDELGPAIEDGLDSLRENDPAAFEALYDRTLDVGRGPNSLGATVFGPAVQLAVGPDAAAQAGVWVTSGARGRLLDGGAGVPLLDFYDQTDLVVPVGAAVRVPGSPVPLAVGATASFIRRWVTAKYTFIDEIDPDGEALYILAGNGLALDLGLHAQDVGTAGLDVGLAVHRLLGGNPGLTYNRRLVVSGADFASDEAEIAELEARFDERGGGPQLRVGAAYRLPAALFAGAGPVRGATVALDYVGASTSEYEQGFGAKLRLGAEATVGPVALRAGIAQGYPALGLGVDVRFARLDYAYFGVEEGRTAGQLRRGAHLLQLRFGLF